MCHPKKNKANQRKNTNIIVDDNIKYKTVRTFQTIIIKSKQILETIPFIVLFEIQTIIHMYNP